MFKFKKLLITIAFLFLQAYAAEECKQAPSLAASQVQSLDEAEVNNIYVNQQVRIISADGKKFNLPYKIAIQSGFFKNMPEQKGSISLPFESYLVKPLLESMKLIYILKNRLNNVELYEFIQQKLFNKFSIEQLAQAFLAATYLEFPKLENLFADAIAQFIKPDSVDYIKSLINHDDWYLIEKFIYLRSNDLKPDTDKFSVDNILAWKLSINDLIDYQVIAIDDEGELDLSNFYLASLDGFERIPNINTVKELLLNGNQITELPENIFKGLNNLKNLSLYNNKLIELPENIFKGLNRLIFLFLSNNQLTELPENIFYGLDNRIILDFSKNPLNAASKELVRQHGGKV